MSQETRKKRSLANSGCNNPMFGKFGELNHMYGKHHTYETKKKMSLVKLGKYLSEEHVIKKAEGCAKTYYFLSPSKEPITIVNLAKFCRDSNGLLSHRHMKRVVKGEKKQYKGWTLDIDRVYHT